MSKSYRKPYGTACSFKNSARKDKQAANRGVRRKQNSWLKGLEDCDFELVPHRHECGHNEVYSWNRDGTQYLMRPSPQEWSEYQRFLQDDFRSDWDREWLERYNSVWPPEWYRTIQRK